MNVQAKIGLCNFVSTVCMLRISSGPEVVIGDPTHGVDDCDVIYDRLPNLIMITNSKTGTNAGTYCSLWGVTIQNLFVWGIFKFVWWRAKEQYFHHRDHCTEPSLRSIF